ncbi:MAG: efflux RND transporter periplasmic adaptor subunit [Sphingorhabdus sp.]
MEQKRLIFILGLAAAFLFAGSLWWTNSGDSDTLTAPPVLQSGQTHLVTAAQIEKLGITTATSQAASDAALGNVPALVTLPPEARVAVTAPFPGSVIRLFVVPGQVVKRGQPLAIVRSREPVQYGAELARAHARLDLAKATAARTAQLAREGIIAGARGDEAQSAVRQAQVDVAENTRVLNQSGANASGEITLRAPITGRLALVNVQTGGPVDGMTAPFVVENTSTLMLDLQLPERLANSVFPGMVVEVPVSGGQPAKGSIVSVSGTIDPVTRSLFAKARMAPSPALVSGKTVTAILKGTSRTPGTSVPTAAVTRIGGTNVVFVRTRNGFEQRSVTVLGRTLDHVVLSAGLIPGEKVATSGLSELKVILGGE